MYFNYIANYKFTYDHRLINNTMHYYTEARQIQGIHLAVRAA